MDLKVAKEQELEVGRWELGARSRVNSPPSMVSGYVPGLECRSAPGDAMADADGWLETGAEAISHSHCRSAAGSLAFVHFGAVQLIFNAVGWS